jgi:hypothetical protein
MAPAADGRPKLLATEDKPQAVLHRQATGRHGTAVAKRVGTKADPPTLNSLRAQLPRHPLRPGWRLQCRPGPGWDFVPGVGSTPGLDGK